MIIPVEMIAHFYPDRIPRPVKFRLKEQDMEYTEVKIDRILAQREEKIGQDRWIIYKCECIGQNDRKRFAEFKFEKARCRWMLIKIQ